MAIDPKDERPEPGPNDVRLRPGTVGPTVAPVEAPEFIESMPVLRQMFFDRRFGVAMLIFLALGVAVVVGVVRVWPSTPAHIKPTQRHSLLDRLQSWSLARTAGRQDAARDYENAFASWRMAVIDHPGNPDLYRGLLRAVAAGPKLRRERLPAFYGSATFLLRLTHTNAVDLSLVAEAYRRQGYEDEAINLLLGRRDELPPAGLGTLIMALYDTGQISRLGPIWARLSPADYEQGELSLFRAGWLAAVGPTGEAPAALARLRTAETNPATAALASRLMIGLAEYRDDPDDCRRSLDRLVAAQKDGFADHIKYWRLLARSGRLEEARRLARAGNRVPQEPHPFAELVRVLLELGLIQDADVLLEQQLQGTGPLARIPRLWALRSRLLESLKRWDDLKIQAVELRSNRMVQQAMAGYGWYLEAIADHELGRGLGTGMALERMLSLGIPDPMLNFESASRLRSLGYGEAAAKLLAQMAQELGGSPEYWFQVQLAAYEGRDLASFRDAAERAHRLQPGNTTFANNLAAALLIQRTEPARSVALTSELRQQNPKDPRLALNHCLALLQNQQYDEARQILSQFDPLKLPAAERSTFHEAAFELANRRGATREMQDHLTRLDRANLFPSQIAWLESTLAKAQAGDNDTAPSTAPK